MSDVAKPCPFCNWPAETVFGKDEPFWVQCTDCGAQGPPEETPEQALEGWNLRAHIMGETE